MKYKLEMIIDLSKNIDDPWVRTWIIYHLQEIIGHYLKALQINMDTLISGPLKDIDDDQD